MVEHGPPTGLLSSSISLGQRYHSKGIKKPVVQPVEVQKLEDPQVSRELGMEVTGRGGRRAGEIL